MADSSAIEWTQATWNPTTGCDKVSAGCGLPRPGADGEPHGTCYALTMAARLKAMGSPKYQNDGDPRTSGPGFGLTVHRDALDIPRRWRSPRLIFVNSMSDLFHAKVPIGFVRDVFAVIAETPRHTYQVLTKRSLRMRRLAEELTWPPNLWMGVSVENQEEADRRIPDLRAVPATVRWVSAEPLLGWLDLRRWLPDGDPLLDWVVVGGESGPGARPMGLGWVRSLRDQCVNAGVPFLFKQVGGRTPKAGGRMLDGRTWDEYPAGHVGVPRG